MRWMNDATVLEMQAVTHRWPGARADAVRIDHLALRAGQRLLVQGASGSGKSTLLALAAGVHAAQQGQVHLLGRNWNELRAAARDARRVDHVGYIFQQFNLLPYLGVLDNVALPCRFSTRRAQRAVAASGSIEAAARELLRQLGLGEDLLGRRASALSVGQQQRVAAARALIGQPELVIADEPTSALDEDLRDDFMALLLRHCEQAGSALLFVSHDRRLAGHFTEVLQLP